jgi:hypothetical protein
MILNKNIINFDKIKKVKKLVLNQNDNTMSNKQYAGINAYETLGFGDRLNRKGVF